MRNKGFTLIEILVGMAIILIVATGSYVGFLSFNRAQSLNIAKDTLRNTLNEARSSALSQVILKCNSSQVLVGHQVRFYTSYYDIEEVCQNVSSPYAITWSQTKRVTLSPDITFNPNPAVPILFLRLTGGTGELINRDVTLRNKGGQTRIVTVNPAGVISSN